MTVLSQIQGQVVLKQIKDGAKATLDSFASIYVLDPSPAKMREFSPLSETLKADGSNVAGVIAALPEEETADFEDRLTKHVSKLPEKDIRKVWAERVGRFRDTAMLYCREDWGDPEDSMEIDARSMSDGTLRFIAIIVAMLTRPADSLIVIEEIDNGLHPSRAGELVSALTDIASSRDFDVLCTTHNPVLIDALRTGNTPFCKLRYTRRRARHYQNFTSHRPARFPEETCCILPGAMMTKTFYPIIDHGPESYNIRHIYPLRMASDS